MRFARESIESQIPEPFTGLKLDHRLAHDIATIELPMDELANKALESANGSIDWKRPGQLFKTEDIPVRRRFWDWILFRSMATIKKKLFGSPQPERIITRTEKHARLGTNGLSAMKESLGSKARTHLQAMQGSIEKTLVRSYVKNLLKRLEESLSERRSQLDQEQARWAKLVESHSEILRLLDQLQASGAESKTSLEGLRKEYLESDVELKPAPKSQIPTSSTKPPTKAPSASGSSEKK